MLLSYSGGAQVATGSVNELHRRLRCPLSVILLGGFHNGANDLSGCQHVHQLTSAKDRIERVGVWMFPHAGACSDGARGTGPAATGR